MRYGEFELIADAVTDETWERIKELKKPIKARRRPFYRLLVWLKGFADKLRCRGSKWVKVPISLDHCTLGEIVEMIADPNQLPYTAGRILLGLDAYEVRKESVDVVMGFTIFVQKELTRILALFASTKVQPTEDERRAGVENLGKALGMFGMVDYISKRQGITLEAAEQMKWKVCYALMLIDRDNAEYQRRLMDEQKRKFNNK